ncbi:MAG: hypothetical protein Q7S21_02440, partial [archaeon]|nr:hypothetical protein [archaeon]
MDPITKFIKSKEEQITKNSNFAVNNLEKDWEKFVHRDTYLVYDSKKDFLNIINKGKKQTSIPWYLFWDLQLKKKLQNNFDALNSFDDKIKNYNVTFVAKKKKEYKELFVTENLVLDDDQQTAVITDDKHNLIVAGAGSGKTEV